MGLVVGLYPHSHESIASYALRLAEKNRCRSPKWILDDCGCEHPAYTSDLSQLNALGTYIGIGGCQTTKIGYPAVDQDQNVLFLGEPVDRSFVRVNPARTCPLCIAERGYHQAYSDLLPLAYCPTHHLAYIDKCPSCHRPISYIRQFSRLCDCGYHLERLACESADSSARRLVQLVVSKIEGCRDLAEEPDGYPQQLLDLDLDSACRLITEIGHLFMPELWRRNGWSADATAGDMKVGFDGVAKVLEDLPCTFERWLEEESSSESGPKKLHGNLRHLYSVLHERLSDPQFEFLRGVYSRHGRNTWSSYLAKKRVTPPHPVAGDPSGRLDGDLVGVADVAAIWGIQHHEAYSLVQCGLLTPVMGPGIDALPHWAVRRSEVLNIWNRIRLQGKITPLPFGQDVGFRTVHEMACAVGLGLADVLGALIAERLDVTGFEKGKVGLKSLLVDFDSACRWLEAMCNREALGVPEAAQLLVMKRAELGRLIEMGALAGSGEALDVRTRLRTTDVFDFARRTMFAARWARRLKLTSRSLQKHVNAMGLKPLIDPVSSGFRLVLYDRQQAACISGALSASIGITD